jgi:hypothetical protein
MHRSLNATFRIPAIIFSLGFFVLTSDVTWLYAQAADNASPRVVASDYPDLHAAVAALGGRTGEIYLPKGEYVLEKTLDLTAPSGGYQGGVRLVGCGRGSRIVARTNGQPVIDLTGTNHAVIENLWINAEQATQENAPNVGLLLARTRSGNASQEHRFTNVMFSGRFSLANVYNVTSELCRFVGCIFINTAPQSYNLVWSSENFANLRSPYQGEIRTLFSNTELRIIGCSFYNWGGGQNGANLHLRGFTMDTSVRDCYMNPPQGGHAVYLGPSSQGGPVESIVFDGIRIEADNAGDVFVLEGRHENVTLRHSSILFGEGVCLRGGEVNTLTMQNNMIWNIRGWKTALKVEDLKNARITDNIYRFQNWGGQNPQEGPQRVLVGQHCRGSTIEVERKELIECQHIERTTIDALDEDGRRRLYLDAAAAGTVLLNLTPVDTSKLTGVKRGDIAVDDGTNTRSGKPALAVYDGQSWNSMD